MAKTKQGAKAAKAKPPPKPAAKPTRAQLVAQAKELGLKGYSSKTVAELAAMVAGATAPPVQAPTPWAPDVEVLFDGFEVTPLLHVRVDGQRELDLRMATQTPRNVQQLLGWVLADGPDGFRAALDAFTMQKHGEVRELLQQRYVAAQQQEAAVAAAAQQPGPNGSEPGGEEG